MSRITRCVVIMAALSACWATTAQGFYFNVDQAVGGPMQLSFDSGSYDAGLQQCTYNFTATNTGVSTLTDVGFTWDYTWNSAEHPQAFTWNDSAIRWEQGATWVQAYGVRGQNGLLSMSRSVTNVPLSWTPAGPYDTGTLVASDSLPMLSLGDFAPLQSKDFTLYADVSDAILFNNTDVGFFVSTVPEPATLSLLGFGVLAAIRRRRK